MKLGYKDIRYIDKWKITTAMKQKGIKDYKQLSKMTGVDSAIISKWVNGKVDISKESKDKINLTLQTW